MAGKSKCVNYKRTTTTSLKVAGYVDIQEDGNVFLGTQDGDMKKLSTLLSDFQGAAVELSVNLKNIEDLPDPTEEDED